MTLAAIVPGLCVITMIHHPNQRPAGVAILATMWLALLAGCGGAPEVERGVHLMDESDTLEPTATFEFRFEQPVVAGSLVGSVATPSPLVITPDLPGEWTWLSRRNGVFHPHSAPLLGRAYRLSLAIGSDIQFERVLRTPEFAVIHTVPRDFNPDNLSCTPSVRVYFNADLKPADAAGFVEFIDATGRRAQANVRQVTRADQDDWSETGPQAPLTWNERFVEAKPRESAARPATPRAAGAKEPDSAQTIANGLVIFPAEPLPVGANWQLRLRAGLPAADPYLQFARDTTIALGNVIPFAATDVSARSSLQSGRRILIEFSKPVSPELNGSNVLKWMAVTPSPSNLVASLASSTVSLEGDFQLDEHYLVTVKAGLPAREPVTQAEAMTQTVTFAPLPPRLSRPGPRPPPRSRRPPRGSI